MKTLSYLPFMTIWGLYYGMILSVPLSDCLALNYRRKTIASGNNVLNPVRFLTLFDVVPAAMKYAGTLTEL